MAEKSTAKSWMHEANAVIKDIKPHVSTIAISTLPSTKQKIYFNLTTLENNDFCVELSSNGFMVVGERFDSKDLKGKYSTHETPYSMLNSLSPAYRNSFGQQLLQRLNKLRDEREREEEEEEENSKRINPEES